MWVILPYLWRQPLASSHLRGVTSRIGRDQLHLENKWFRTNYVREQRAGCESCPVAEQGSVQSSLVHCQPVRPKQPTHNRAFLSLLTMSFTVWLLGSYRLSEGARFLISTLVIARDCLLACMQPSFVIAVVGRETVCALWPRGEATSSLWLFDTRSQVRQAGYKQTFFSLPPFSEQQQGLTNLWLCINNKQERCLLPRLATGNTSSLDSRPCAGWPSLVKLNERETDIFLNFPFLSTISLPTDIICLVRTQPSILLDQKVQLVSCMPVACVYCHGTHNVYFAPKHYH